jgi:hypothetical protein
MAGGKSFERIAFEIGGRREVRTTMAKSICLPFFFFEIAITLVSVAIAFFQEA